MYPVNPAPGPRATPRDIATNQSSALPDDLTESGILDPAARVVFFPVRHHSPAAARALQEVARAMMPAAILIEGPADFNPLLPEMSLPHTLPIAIYSYVRLAEGPRRGAFYPFCIYSPEWQALSLARELGAEARFIDLPWAEMAAGEEAANRYSDAELRGSDYVGALCRRLGVNDLDALWDTLFESDPALTAADYLKRCHHFCYHLRRSDGQVSGVDHRREAYMAGQIQEWMAERSGRVLVITGGFHSFALFARIHGLPFEDREEAAAADAPAAAEKGIALTPYSYARLDSLTGYNAGMPNPGFYDQVWHDRQAAGSPQTLTYRSLLAKAVRELRQRGQMASSADLIAVETSARALADLRGHAEVWRLDLIDGILSALVKDEYGAGALNPFLRVLYDVFRGSASGRLAEGTLLPPLVEDIRRRTREHDLEFTPTGPAAVERIVDLDLHRAKDLERSRLLHQMRVLGLVGCERTAGSDLTTREDLSRIWERWRLRWTPDFDAGCIEAALYGTTLMEAAAARLMERIGAMERDAEAAAIAMLDTALMGLPHLAPALEAQMRRLVLEDGDFFGLTRALGHLLYLHRYDETLGTAGSADVGRLLREAFSRCLWLLEALGQVQGRDRDFLEGVRLLIETARRAGADLNLESDELASILQRAGADPSQPPLVRGAVGGALWSLGRADMDRILRDMRDCAAPDQIGDFLTGLFHLARETAQRDPALVQSLDRTLLEYDAEGFLAALPALRLAFSYFAPREKHYMARTLMTAGEAPPLTSLSPLDVSPENAARALAWEERLFAALDRYGLRGGVCDGR